LDEYNKRSDKLFGVLSEIKYKVEQITWLRDGVSTCPYEYDRIISQLTKAMQISSFTNVEQSLESLEQNSNIRILTFITIAYLPLGFVAVRITPHPPPLPRAPGPFSHNQNACLHISQALFSIGYGILPESAGRGLFIGLIILFFTATITMGTFIETITNIWEDGKEFWKERAEKEEKEGKRPQEHAAWKDFVEKFKVKPRGGGKEKKVDERKKEQTAWKDRFRVRRRRGERGRDGQLDVEVGVNGNGSEGTGGAKES